jgi:hypothetical protein
MKNKIAFKKMLAMILQHLNGGMMVQCRSTPYIDRTQLIIRTSTIPSSAGTTVVKKLIPVSYLSHYGVPLNKK